MFSDRTTCPDAAGRCFRMSSFLYMPLHDLVSWYKAKEDCGKKGMYLAYIQHDNIRVLAKEITRLNKNAHSVWIGLRKAEFQIAGGKAFRNV